MGTSPSGPLFPRLASGPRKMDAEAVARNQRGRLQGAMVEAVARHGYAPTTLRELVSLAGVSKSTFYEHYECKQDCFLATFDTLIDQSIREIAEAFDEPGDLREKLLAGMKVFTRQAAEQKDASYIVAVESLTLGSAGVAHRDRASDQFAKLVRKGFDEASTPREVSDLEVRGIVAGIRNSAYQHLRKGRSGELPAYAEPIVEWVLTYGQPPVDRVLMAVEASRRPIALRPAPAEDGWPDWSEAPDSKRSRETLNQRERIIRAAARIGVEKGYDALSIPAISAGACVSNQTFYDNFPGKREAFVAAFDALAAEALRVVAAAVDDVGERPAAVGAGLRALLTHIAEDELFARLAFFELPTAGQAALDQADRVLGGFTSFLGPEDTSAWHEGPASSVLQEMIGGGVWAVIQHEINSGRVAELPELAPQIVEFAITPFVTPAPPASA